MKVNLIVIEGIHLRRGYIASLCCHHAIPHVPIVALSWNAPFMANPALTVAAYPTIAEYYRAFRTTLSTIGNALIIPCTLLGAVVANEFAGEHFVLAEPMLTDIGKYDKLALKAQQPALHSFFPPYSPATAVELPFPLLAKLRLGHSADGQRILTSEDDLRRLPDPSAHFVEAIIPSPMHEYSMTIVRSESKVKWMCIKREHQDNGRTVIASKVRDEIVLSAAALIAKHLAFETIYNVQFAMTQERPAIYDLNPRFGHSELYRTCFGFNFVSAFANSPASPHDTRTSLQETEALRVLSRKLEAKV